MEIFYEFDAIEASKIQNENLSDKAIISLDDQNHIGAQQLRSNQQQPRYTYSFVRDIGYSKIVGNPQ